MNETMKTIMNRRSIRAYQPEQIRENELQVILDGGKFAPSAINEQPWHFSVVQNKDVLHRINEACRAVFINSGNPRFAERAKDADFNVFYNAPTLIIISGEQQTVAPQIDCALALQNMFLAAESMGIGSCWIHAIASIIQADEFADLKKELGIPEGHIPFCTGAFGYKAMESETPERKQNTVTYIR